MKKLLAILLTLLMIFTLVGCNSKEDTPMVNEPEQQEEVVEPIKEDEPIVDGFVDAEDKTITDELKDIFNKALDGLTGAKYEPVELVATQVVAGTNFKFLANGTKTTDPITKGTYYITIYKDLQGNIELKDIEVIEEKQEQVKEEVHKQDITQMSFWVVFYDQYGNELQREALKYGTVPEYKTWLPEGFDKWIYKRSGKDVGTLKAITGNTYYQAVCHEVHHSSGGGSNPSPNPPAPVDISSYTMKSGITWFNTFTTPTNRNQITDIIFTNSAPSGSVEDVDLTADTTGKVKGYYIQDGAYHKIYIVGDYIYGNEDCGAMFAGFSNLSTLDLGNFNTSTVTDMQGMFNACSSLASLNVNNFDTSNVTAMNSMFAFCLSLASLDLSNFNTTSVTKMDGMFNGCSGLASITLNSFNTSNVNNMSNMFKDCSNLSTINLSSFNTSSVTNMYRMFNGCSGLTSLDLSLFEPGTSVTTSEMFDSCSNLTTVKNNARNSAIEIALSGLGTSCNYNTVNSSFEITH